MEGLSDVLGSLIAAQVSGKVVGEGADEVSSDYFRLSTGLYDAAAVGTVRVRPVLLFARATPLSFSLWLASKHCRHLEAVSFSYDKRRQALQSQL